MRGCCCKLEKYEIYPSLEKEDEKMALERRN
jgi:hypothetical protein